MKKVLLLFYILVAHEAAAQRYFSKNASAHFYSYAPLENIEAVNNKGVCIIDVAKSTVEMAVLLKGFQFKKALMQEHFNESYVESDRYPKATFKGLLLDAIDWNKTGTYTTRVKGTLSLHGVSKEETATALVKIANNTISATADLQITLADYNIKIPAVVSNKISKTVKIAISVPNLIVRQ